MYVVCKNAGETPLELLGRVRRAHRIDSKVKMAYAGRLDPLASGVMIVLVGDECQDRTRYERLDKEYEFEVLLGVATDTYDLMGLIDNGKLTMENAGESYQFSIINSQLQSLVGSWEQPYPPYSSARVGGHPLYWWARAGRLGEIQAPTKRVTVKEVETLPPKQGVSSADSVSKPFPASARLSCARVGDAPGLLPPADCTDGCFLTGAEVAERAVEQIGRVSGDFRQDMIIAQWKGWGARFVDVQLPIIKVRIVCSSGTYVRGICHKLGKRLGCGALAYSIHRTRVGEYVVESPEGDPLG